MTEDEIMSLWNEHADGMNGDTLLRFANAVAAKEREACAKVCDELIAPDIYRDTEVSMWDVTCMECAQAIRARGQA
jgi:hypothetical protein